MTRILVVEDEESFRDALSYMLRKEGFEVVLAENGPSALEEFDRHGADLVLLDLMLPGLSGTEVCRAIRAKSSVPVIMLTAKAPGQTIELRIAFARAEPVMLRTVVVPAVGEYATLTPSPSPTPTPSPTETPTESPSPSES